MFNATLDTPTVSRTSVKFSISDSETERTANKVSGLLMGVRVTRYHTALFELKLSKQRARSMREGLEPNSRQGILISRFSRRGEHMRCD